jgi:hypothetical protein
MELHGSRLQKSKCCSSRRQVSASCRLTDDRPASRRSLYGRPSSADNKTLRPAPLMDEPWVRHGVSAKFCTTSDSASHSSTAYPNDAPQTE